VRESTGPVVLEAENATVVGAVVSRGETGYSGTGFVDYGVTPGQYVEFTFDNTGGAGARTLTFRYANGSSQNRPLELKVNGVVVQPALAFAPTTGWSTWRTVTVTAQLAAGVNKIRLTMTGTIGPNLDSLTID
jgi:endoglucanase